MNEEREEKRQRKIFIFMASQVEQKDHSVYSYTHFLTIIVSILNVSLRGKIWSSNLYKRAKCLELKFVMVVNSFLLVLCDGKEFVFSDFVDGKWGLLLLTKKYEKNVYELLWNRKYKKKSAFYDKIVYNSRLLEYFRLALSKENYWFHIEKFKHRFNSCRVWWWWCLNSSR